MARTLSRTSQLLQATTAELFYSFFHLAGHHVQQLYNTVDTLIVGTLWVPRRWRCGGNQLFVQLLVGLLWAVLGAGVIIAQLWRGDHDE